MIVSESRETNIHEYQIANNDKLVYMDFHGHCAGLSSSSTVDHAMEYVAIYFDKIT